MSRLPRKLKKKVKKIVAKKQTLKTVMSAMVTAQSMAHMAIISSMPSTSFVPPPVTIADKSLKVVNIVMDTAKAVQRIVSEPPNSWRDFIKTNVY